MDTAALAELDRTHLWHPFTQQRGWEPPLMRKNWATVIFSSP
jgi:hypothetical protein